MTFATFLPGAVLKPYVKAYHVIESPSDVVNRILPDTSLTMVFRFRGSVSALAQGNKDSLPTAAISGLRKSGRSIAYAAGAGNIIVRLREAAANVFFKEPLSELFQNTVSLNDLAGYRDLSFVEDALADASDHKQRISIVESFLKSRLASEKLDKTILSAVDAIRNSPSVRISSLASDHCLSQDAFEKRFKRVVGARPKQFVYLARMGAIVKSDLKNKSLVETAVEAGYFDQSHFNKDFKLYTGQTPTEFIKSVRAW
ncbi:AraC family transcriptional regulator [Cytophagales bacterium WSM2-2]|nr:AraC family transcriptional regulator [Cytophagales bacterium WSM2-2]